MEKKKKKMRALGGRAVLYEILLSAAWHRPTPTKEKITDCLLWPYLHRGQKSRVKPHFTWRHGRGGNQTRNIHFTERSAKVDGGTDEGNQRIVRTTQVNPTLMRERESSQERTGKEGRRKGNL